MAKKKRFFSPHGIPEKKDDYHGDCDVYRLIPDIGSKGIKSVNAVLTFEEAMRLSTALESAILKLNRYKRSIGGLGSKMGVALSLKTNTQRIAVFEVIVRASAKRGSGK